MGFLGIPMVKTKASGKVGLGWSGGFYEAVSEVGEKISEVEAAIKAYNDGPQTNEVLKNNFDAFRANVTIQEQKEKALEEGDVYNYKNAEHDELHNYVENKMQNGILDTVYQDIEALKEMSLEEFNKQFAHKEVDYQFTDENGYVTETSYYDQDDEYLGGKNVPVTQNVYDSHGSLVKVTNMDEKRRIINHPESGVAITEYRYDEPGNRIETIRYDKNRVAVTL